MLIRMHAADHVSWRVAMSEYEEAARRASCRVMEINGLETPGPDVFFKRGEDDLIRPMRKAAELIAKVDTVEAQRIQRMIPLSSGGMLSFNTLNIDQVNRLITGRAGRKDFYVTMYAYRAYKTISTPQSSEVSPGQILGNWGKSA